MDGGREGTATAPLLLAPGSPHSPDADFETRSQVFSHKLAVTAPVIHDVLPGKTGFWEEETWLLERPLGPPVPLFPHTLWQ